jgi:putative phosphoesterase
LRIGIISDTHDNLQVVEKAINRLNQEKVTLVLHAGDYVSPFVIPKFKTLNCKLIGVFGNNDGDHAFIKQKFSETKNCEIHSRFAEVVADNFRIGLLHGEETELLTALINSQNFDAVIYGHSHSVFSGKNSKTLIINPGELCGYLTGRSTMAILNTNKKETEIIDLYTI